MVKIRRELIPKEHNGISTPRTIELYLDGIYLELLRGFRRAVHKKKTSCVFIFDGRSGMGKSTLAMQTGITVDPEFGLHKVHFSPETFLKGDGDKKIGLANCKKGDFILFDEAMLISNRSAMSKINKMIVQAMSMIRSKSIFVGFCVNSLFDIDRNLILHRAEALFHVYGDTLISRGRFCGFYTGKDKFNRLKSLYLNGKKLYDYSKPNANMVGKFTKEFVIDEKLYEQEKQKGIEIFLKDKSRTTLTKGTVIKRLLIKGMGDKDIREALGIDGYRYAEIMAGNDELL